MKILKRIAMPLLLTASMLLMGAAVGCLTVNVPAPSGGETPSVTPSSGSSSAAAGLPVIMSFKAEPQQIVAGAYATLSWEVSGASTVRIDQGIGAVDMRGSRQVSPSVNTIYTLTAENVAGSVKGTVTVAMAASLNAATIALTADDVKAGGWQSGYAKQLSGEDVQSGYSVTYTRGAETLTNNVYIYKSLAIAEREYYAVHSKYRSGAQSIYTIGDNKAFVTQEHATDQQQEKYGIHFQKDNVYVQLGTISNYKELEKYAQLLEKRIHY